MTVEGLLGRKLGMLQVFDDEGRLRGATALEVGPCWVTQVRTEEKDGYAAVQLGYGEKKKLNKPASGHLAASGAPNLRHLAEFRATGEVSLGDQIGADIFEQGELVDVTATSKGRGFQGGVKRHHFRGGPKTHGQSDRHRAPGSIGAGTTPGRVFKGTRMAGHMGAARTTVRNLEVIGRNDERGVIFVAGTVPGPPGGLVRVRHARAVAGSRGKA
ncbi:MAG: 50S ribosomal protein L3 [Dehalococcoidia bacterium]|nr:50S ribosomal protein L3 [Dehalococcoidia bacterium]MYK25635.1 50S ribosomal protein L3 [Dehalococcoidia bacterium]